MNISVWCFLGLLKKHFFSILHAIVRSVSHSLFLLDRRDCGVFFHMKSKSVILKNNSYYFYLRSNETHWQVHDWKKWAKSFFLVDAYIHVIANTCTYNSLHKILKITRAFHTYTYVNMKHLHTCERERKRGRESKWKRKKVPIFHVRET